jgi:hypothetical protein
VPGLNDIRQAQQLLVDDGLVETRQGVSPAAAQGYLTDAMLATWRAPWPSPLPTRPRRRRRQIS